MITFILGDEAHDLVIYYYKSLKYYCFCDLVLVEILRKYVDTLCNNFLF